MKKAYKQIISSLLITALFIGVIFCSGFGMTASAATAVSGIAVKLNKPIAGAPFDWTAYIPNTTQYSRYTATISASGGGAAITTGVSWYDITDGKTITDSTATAVEGHVYYATVYVKANTGYEFTGHNSLPYTFNGTSDTGVGIINTTTKNTVVGVSSPHYTCAKPVVTVYNNAESGEMKDTSYTYKASVTLNASASPKSGRKVYCVVSDSYGLSKTSDVATLTSATPFEITEQPKSAYVTKGAKTTVSVTATGDGLSYEWYVRHPNDEHGEGEEEWYTLGEDAASVETPSIYDEVWMFCVITDINGNELTSSRAVFMPGVKVSITEQPKDASADNDEYVSTTVKANGTDLTYTWYVLDPGKTEFVKSSVKKETYSFRMEADKSGRQVYCVVKDGMGNTVKTRTAILSSSGPIIILGQPQNASAPVDKYVSTTVVAEGEELRYEWWYADKSMTEFAKSSITDPTYSFKMSTAKSGRQVFCVIYDRSGSSETTRTATLTASSSESVKITTQPKDVSVAEGKTASAKVVASGSGLTYTWYIRDPGKASYSKSSIKTDTYSVVMTAAKNGRKAYCVVADANGNSVTSNIVTLSITGTVKITGQPQNVVVAEGELASTKVTATGDGLTYTWYVLDPGKTDYVKSSIKKDTYEFTMSAAKDGRKVYCVVADANGNSVKSSIATLSMITAPVITTQPKSVTVAEGEFATVTIEATGYGLTYEWYYRDKGDDGGFNLTTSFKDDTYSVTMNAERDGRELFCTVTDKNGNYVNSDVVTINMSKPLKITAQPQSVTVAAGKTAAVSVVATGEGLTYKWYYKNKGDSGFTYTSSFKTNKYSVEMNEARNGRQIYCVVTDANGDSVQSNTVTLSMSGSSVVITTQPKDVTVAAGKFASVTVVATGEGLTYKWYYKNKGDSGFTYTSSFKTNKYSVEMNEARDGRQVYCVVTDANGNSVQSDTATLSMATSTLKITTQPRGAEAQDGELTSTYIVAAGEGLTYTWYVLDPGKSDYVKSSITKDIYEFTMSESKDGRRVYCVVNDKYGNSVKSDVAEFVLGIFD